MGIVLGHRPSTGTPVTVGSLNEHLVVLGSTGSGKTYAAKRVIQEAVLAGDDVIAFDRQGDLASFMLPSRRSAQNPYYAAAWSLVPKSLLIAGTHVGIGTDLTGEPRDAAEQLVDLLDLSAGKRLDALATFMRLIQRGATSIDVLMAKLAAGDKAEQRLATALEVTRAGPLRKLISRPAFDPEKRAPLTILYTGGLDLEVEEPLFIARTLERIAEWMRTRDDSRSVLVFLDEVADLVPPVAKPAPKQSIMQLLRQGRKFNVGCILASQNPGDLDYKGLSQCRTWLLGRIATQQDREKVLDRVRSMAPDNYDTVFASLMQLKAGQFWMLTPGHCKRVNVAQLYSPHTTVAPARIDKIACSWHQPSA